MLPDSIIEYVHLLKLIRGVLLASSGINREEKDWLRRAIRWRPVGAGSETGKILKRSGFSSKKVLSLVYAFQSHKKLGSLLEECGISKEISEALILSSTYIAPLIILDQESLSNLSRRGLIISDVKSDTRIKDKTIKLHLRIAEYSMKDEFLSLIHRARSAIIKNQIDDELVYRRNFCEKDVRRYWRINRSRGKPIVIYVDPLRALSTKADELREIISTSEEAVLGLGICVGICLPNMIKQ
ncbi:MAG: hypothetical protein NDP24_00350 [Crenarchaeota archaeon]|nr:hypothetical protein [Thermoproteota archaeon]MCR8473609.1 hypothetical protein [Thermoproteota archaeon]MCR8487145.1 hypothetical protein [Thermoproteota archaeon]